MKKFLFGLTVIAIATLGVVKAIDVNETNSLSNLQLENVEALGQEIEIEVGPVCQYHEDYICRWSDGFEQIGWFMCKHSNETF